MLAAGHALQGDRMSGFWRFNRVNNYGALALETPEQLDAAVGRHDLGRDPDSEEPLDAVGFGSAWTTPISADA